MSVGESAAGGAFATALGAVQSGLRERFHRRERARRGAPVHPEGGQIVKHRFATHFLFAVMSVSIACDKSATPTAPTTSTPPNTPAVLQKVTITGNSSLTALGQTSQLTASAILSDGTVK